MKPIRASQTIAPISPSVTGAQSRSRMAFLRRQSRRLTVASREGMTLLEIILALTIFFGALTVLSQLTWNGSRAAVQARLKTQAIIRCEAKLAEVLARVEALAPKTRVPFPDNAQWTYSINVAESQYPDLLQIQVTVFHAGNSSLSKVEFSLSRWMRDPSLFLEAAELKKTEDEKQTIEQIALAVAGADKVDNQLEVNND